MRYYKKTYMVEFLAVSCLSGYMIANFPSKFMDKMTHPLYQFFLCVILCDAMNFEKESNTKLLMFSILGVILINCLNYVLAYVYDDYKNYPSLDSTDVYGIPVMLFLLFLSISNGI